MTDPPPANGRAYGCTWGCGNPYDFVLVTVADGTSEFLCLPCLVRLAADMIAAVTEPDNPLLQAALVSTAGDDITQAPGPRAMARGKNAPATTDDDDLIESYSGIITEDELPEVFR